MNTQEITDKIASLPEHLQHEVLDFVEFIISKYKPDTEAPLTGEQQEELDRRYTALQENPDRGIDWEDAKASLKSKYGL